MTFNLKLSDLGKRDAGLGGDSILAAHPFWLAPVGRFREEVPRGRSTETAGLEHPVAEGPGPYLVER